MTMMITGSGQGIITQSITAEMFKRFALFIDASQRTIQTYMRNLKPFMNYLFERSIAQPTREDILRYKESLMPHYAPATVTAYIIPVRLFFQWTEEEGLYPNIANRIKGAKLNRDYKRDYLTKEQAKQLLNSIKRDSIQSKRDYAILTLMLTCGLRTIEIIRADKKDLRPAGDQTVLYVQGKGRDSKDEYVIVPAQTEAAIRDYLKARSSSNTKDPLFVSEANRNQGERMTTRSISRLAKNHLILTGLESDRLTAHSLRHTAATLSRLNGASLQETQGLMRHADPSTTALYDHSLDKAKNNASRIVAGALFE